MALRWQWNEKIGYIKCKYEGNDYEKEYELQMYQGNALLICLHEFKDEKGVDVWEMSQFFVGDDHFKNCVKDKTWNYAETWLEMVFFESPPNDLWKVVKETAKRGVKIIINEKTKPF